MSCETVLIAIFIAENKTIYNKAQLKNRAQQLSSKFVFVPGMNRPLNINRQMYFCNHKAVGKLTNWSRWVKGGSGTDKGHKKNEAEVSGRVSSVQTEGQQEKESSGWWMRVGLWEETDQQTHEHSAETDRWWDGWVWVLSAGHCSEPVQSSRWV